MLNPFICGNFHNQEEEDDQIQSPCTTPKRSKKSSKDNNNPYATRGLDKFSALLAELEEKRQKIYSQVGPQEISFVRFVFSSSNDCVPIIVKMKDQNKEKTLTTSDNKSNMESLDNSKLECSTDLMEEHRQRLELEKKSEISSTWDLNLRKLRRPSVYMPVFVILILLFLAFFGRSVAILCTSIGWYLVPTLSSKRFEKPAKKKKKKQLMRRYSEITHSHRSKNIEEVKDKSNHGRQNSF